MKKIPSLFIRDYEQVISSFSPTHASSNIDGSHSLGGRAECTKGRFLATTQVTPGCEWVINGYGVPTRKWDGTAVMIQGGSIFRRYDAKNGKTPPDGFIPCQDPDIVTGHWPGWIRINPMSDANQDKWIWEALFNTFPGGDTNGEDGTYEAIGPKINSNRDKWDRHELRKHGDVWLQQGYNYRTYEGLKQVLSEYHE